MLAPVETASKVQPLCASEPRDPLSDGGNRVRQIDPDAAVTGTLTNLAQMLCHRSIPKFLNRRDSEALTG